MSRPLRWLHRLALSTAACTAFLVFAGGMVTSTGSGLAVPDWPLSYGQLFPPMVGGIFYEHGHRMVAGFVALLTAALALFAGRVEPRRWVRRLAAAALAAVLVQALLGGLTVLFLLPIAISVAHAGVANLFFCSVVTLALVTGPSWRGDPADRLPATAGRLPGIWATLTSVTFLQIMVGALMRHSGAGLAIPDFPLAFGRILPPFTTWPVLIHFAHRAGALVVLAAACWAVTATVRRAGRSPAVVRPAVAVMVLVPCQILLGGITIWSGRAPLITSLHVVVGTLTLAASLWTMLQARHLAPAAPSRLAARTTLARERLA